MATERSKREDSWKTAPATGHIQQHYVQISCTIYSQNWLRNVDSWGRNSLTPLSKVWLSLNWFSETHARSTMFLKNNTEFHKIPINGSVVDTRSQTDKRTRSSDNADWFYFVNNAQNTNGQNYFRASKHEGRDLLLVTSMITQSRINFFLVVYRP